METLFWSALFFIFYAYFGYALILWILAQWRSRPVLKGKIILQVSFIITAHNEEKRIQEKIENTLLQDYPKDKLQIIVASDCSSDRTDEIVISFADKGVQLVRAPERKGKEAAQKLALEGATGDILIFSDVATILPSSGVVNMVKSFCDPTVGCVSSVDKIITSEGKAGGESAYVKYEMLLRQLETRVNTLVGLSGSFFAARREVCKNWQPELQSDFNTLLNAIRLGLRGVSDPESVGYYKMIDDEAKEYERKVRTVLRGIAVFMQSLPMLNPFRYGLFSWQLVSHKLCRWLVPFAMIVLLLSNAALIRAPFYQCLFILQCIGYGIALQTILTKRFPEKSFLKLPAFFVLVNLSILNAWCRYIKGERIVRWNPSQREIT